MKNIIQELSAINLLDLLVGLVLIAIISVFLFLRFQKKEEWVYVTVVVSQREWWWDTREPPYWYVDGLRLGDKANNTLGKEVAEIVELNVFEQGGTRKKAIIELKVNATYDKTKEVYLFNQKPLAVGSFLNLSFNGNNLQGLVTNLANRREELGDLETKEVRLLLQKKESWLVDSIKEGLAMKDTQGNNLATIERVEVQPNRYSSFEFEGGELTTKNKDYVDIVLDVKLKSYKSNDAYYFLDGAGLKVGGRLWLFFPEVMVEGATITKILK